MKKSLDEQLVDLLGVVEADRVRKAFDLRYHERHECDDVGQKDYLVVKERCWGNYCRAYYGLPKSKKGEGV